MKQHLQWELWIEKQVRHRYSRVSPTQRPFTSLEYIPAEKKITKEKKNSLERPSVTLETISTVQVSRFNPTPNSSYSESICIVFFETLETRISSKHIHQLGELRLHSHLYTFGATPGLSVVPNTGDSRRRARAWMTDITSINRQSIYSTSHPTCQGVFPNGGHYASNAKH